MMRRADSQARRGATSIQMLVILVPVLLGLIGFAYDLGQLYVVKGELQTAANSMALAAASRLIGTDLSIETANSYARLTLSGDNGTGNRYFFGGYEIGSSNGLLTSDAPDPTYYSTAASAIGTDGAAGGEAGGADAKHTRVTLTAEAPLTFWSFLPIATERKVAISARAVAGISPPLCVACGIDPIAVAPLDSTDTVDFGFIAGTEYTFGFNCTGAPVPQPLPGGTARVPYLILNRLNSSATVFADEQSQLYRIGAGGLPGNTDPNLGCFTINNTEQIWATALPVACSASTPGSSVVSLLCGITSRFEPTYPDICAGIADIDTMSTLFPQDLDNTQITDYTQYIGNGRRIITIPIVDALNPGGDMTVLAFRQFLIQPLQGGVDISPSDPDGRFDVLYLGSVAPVKQGRFSGCQQTSGPGKTVLHQ